jgi:type IV pilus assembly protein PilN
VIRINLLAPRRNTVGRRGSRPEGRILIAGGLILVLTAAVVGVWMWRLARAEHARDQAIAAAQHEVQQLQPVLDQVQRFERRKEQLEQRVGLIEQLRKAQGDPVRLLDALSRSVPDGVWLTALRQNGRDLVLEGRSTSLIALSDFVASMEASGRFHRPVEILDSQVEMSPDGDLVRFSVKAPFDAGAASP